MSHLFFHPSVSDKTKSSRLRLSLLLILVLFSFLTFWKLLHSPPAFLLNEDQRFVRFTETVFRNEMSGNTLSRHYTLANPAAYHISRKEVSLGDASPAAYKKSHALLENHYRTLVQFDRSKLSKEHQLTYDLFRDHLETELSGAELYLYEEPLSSSLGIQAQLPVLLAEYAFRTKGDIEDYLTLLSQIPDYFESILTFEQKKAEQGLFMGTGCADEVILQCKQFIQNPETNYLIPVFNEKIDEISNLTMDEKISYKSRNKTMLLGYVIPAYESLISGIAALQTTQYNDKGLYYLPEGTSYYRYLVKSTTGDNRTIEEIEEAIKVRMVEDFSQIQKLINDSDQTTADSALPMSPTKSTDPYSGSTLSPLSLLEDLSQKITADFPLLPAVSCDVKYVHDSLKEHLSPAFYLTPPIDDYTNNVIYINPANDYNSLELYTTLAHEGYPGHLYQSVYFASTRPDLLRYILDTGGYTEGWATYVELEYAHNYWNGNSTEASLGRFNRSFTLGLASLLDIGIHYRGYSLSDVETFLEKMGFQKDTAKSLYESILQSPGNYLKYFVGYLNFCELRKEQQQKLGAQFSLKEFHRKILEAGPMPFQLLKQQF